MRIATLSVFDDIISGTGPWYSGAQHERSIGSADVFAIQAHTTMVTGTATLTVQSEHSADSEHWFTAGTAEINGPSITDNNSYYGANSNRGSSVRFKITLGGTSPQCRLKLYVTLRRTTDEEQGK